MNENPSPETLVGEPQLSTSNGGGTVESPSLSLAELNSILGADFKDTSTALKALKDTKDFVGKRKEDIAAEVKASLQQTASDVASKSDVQELKNQLFYAQNPQYKGYESLIKKLGNNPADVTNSEEFKTVFEKATIADEVVNNKSVVSTNSRLSQSQSVVSDAIGIANARGSTIEDVATMLAKGINQDNTNMKG